MGWFYLEGNKSGEKALVCWYAEEPKLDKESQCWRGQITSFKQFGLISWLDMSWKRGENES